MKVGSFIKELKKFPLDLEVEFYEVGGHLFSPKSFESTRKRDTLTITMSQVCLGYVIRKDFIKGDTTEVCPLPMLGIIDTKEQAAVFLSKNIFDEIGWTMPDIKGKFAEVLKEVEGTSPERKYSFANCEWWIEEVY